MENWKDIPGYEGLYQASNLGNIRSAPGKTTASARFPNRVWKMRVLKPKHPKSDNYRHDLRVSLWKGDKVKDWLVARLIALTWVDGYSSELTVNHINGDYLDNRSSNLEWVTREDNIKLGFETGLFNSLMKPITLCSGNECFDFKSLASASRWLGRNGGYLNNAIKKGHVIRSINGEKYSISNPGGAA